LKAVFLGTPEFAVATLERMLKAGYQVAEVITQPDRPQGRKQELIPSPVKAAALRHGLPVYQPERIRRPEAVQHLTALAPDVMVVVGYGQIIPQTVIDIAPLGIINVHASVLPELRGAAPIQWAVARGYAKTGVSTMSIDAGLDTGDVIHTWETEIGPEETAPELSQRLAAAGADLLVKTLAGLAAGTAERIPQDNARATLAPILKKEDGRIDWRKPAKEIHNQIRGLLPWPGAYTSFRGQQLHLWRARMAERRWDVAPGSLIREHGVFAVGGDGAAVELLEVQAEGRKKMAADVFANGHRIVEVEQLGG
jgi:methionyl-tRNA formyltransferase